MREPDLMRSIMIATTNDVDWFRNNCGAYDANPECPHCGLRRVPTQAARWVHYGVGGAGGSDLIGIARANGVFVAAEIKTRTGRATAEQLQFINRVRLNGGLGCVARCVEDVLEALRCS